ncbi:hypothetical protein C0991_004090 [Blastosporella zonata]|nr:hypothetical protein C0991_004090 [Blastosporella zonata]
MRLSVLLSLFATLAVSGSASPLFGNEQGNGGYQPPHQPAVVKGKVFSRLVTIWLENTDYTPAATNPDLVALAKQGLILSNYFAVTHPSEPNYVAVRTPLTISALRSLRLNLI